METNNLSKEQLVSLAQFLEGQERAYETNKLALYQPKAGLQDAFHRSNKKIRLLVTGNRGGKTTCITIEAIWLALGIHPHHPIPVPNRGKLYGESYSAIMESIKMKFDEWCPLAYLHPTRPYSKNQLGQIIGVNFKNGSIIRFGTYDQQAEKSESSNWNYVGFDEPPRRDLYIANLRAITDFGGIMWFSMTPLSEAWIYDELWIPGITGEKKHIECFNWSTDKNPFLNKEGMELFFSEMTEDEKEVRFKGKFMRLKGLVIDTYDPELSDVDPFILDSSFCIFEGLDPHPRKPNATLWKAVNRDGFRYAVRELYFDGGIYEWGQRIAEVRRELRSHGAHFTKSIADTSLNQKDLMFKINQKDELNRSLRAAGESVLPSMAQKRDWVLPGLQKLRDLFRPVQLKDLDKKMPMEYLFKGMVPRYKRELLHHQWGESMADNAKPVESMNDLISCSRYVESIAPHYETPGSSIIRANKGAYQRLLPDERIFPDSRL